jgi:hypothetical protein
VDIEENELVLGPVRTIARAIVVLAIPWAAFLFVLLLLAMTSGAPGAFFYALILGPGWLVYVGLIQKARGREVVLDPYGTWLGCVVINVAWAALFAVDFRARALYMLGFFSSLLFAGLGVLGLTAAVRARRATPPAAR